MNLPPLQAQVHATLTMAKTAKVWIGRNLVIRSVCGEKKVGAPQTLITHNDRFDDTRCIATAT